MVLYCNVVLLLRPPPCIYFMGRGKGNVGKGGGLYRPAGDSYRRIMLPVSVFRIWDPFRKLGNLPAYSYA
jgi:hypothetical protein